MKKHKFKYSLLPKKDTTPCDEVTTFSLPLTQGERYPIDITPLVEPPLGEFPLAALPEDHKLAEEIKLGWQEYFLQCGGCD